MPNKQKKGYKTINIKGGNNTINQFIIEKTKPQDLQEKWHQRWWGVIVIGVIIGIIILLISIVLVNLFNIQI